MRALKVSYECHRKCRYCRSSDRQRRLAKAESIPSSPTRKTRPGERHGQCESRRRHHNEHCSCLALGTCDRAEIVICWIKHQRSSFGQNRGADPKIAWSRRDDHAPPVAWWTLNWMREALNGTKNSWVLRS